MRVVPLSSFSRYGRPLTGLHRSFYLAYRENELGSLPSNLYDLFRNTFERQVAVDIGEALSIDPRSIFFMDQDEVAGASS